MPDLGRACHGTPRPTDRPALVKAKSILPRGQSARRVSPDSFGSRPHPDDWTPPRLDGSPPDEITPGAQEATDNRECLSKAKWNRYAYQLTRLTERFGIQHPIVCAPMALVTGGALAAAVSHAGGLGIVGGGYAGIVGGEPDLDARTCHREIRQVWCRIISLGVGARAHMLTKALQYSPSCVFLSFGDPAPFAAQIATTRVRADLPGAVAVADRHGFRGWR